MKYQKEVLSALIRLAGTSLAFYILWNAGLEYYNFAWGLGTWLGGFTPKLGLGFLALVFLWLFIFILILVLLWWRDKTIFIESVLSSWRDRLGWLRWILILVIMVIPVWFLQYSYWGGVFTGKYLRLMLFLGAGWVVSLLVTQSQKRLTNIPNLAAGLLLVASGLTFGRAIANVTDYPFTLFWSEGNRIWDYSVLFGRRLYIYPTDQPIFAYIDFGRQALWGLPFLFFDASISVVRLWSGLLFSVPYAIFGWVVFKKGVNDRRLWALSGLWAMCFLNQGPIYTPLVLSAALVAIAWQVPLWIGLPLIGIAGYYAQMSRFTWMFAPAMWAGLLFFGELPLKKVKVQKIMWLPAISGVLAGLLGGYFLPRLQDFVQRGSQAVKNNPAVSNAATDVDIISLEGVTSAVSRQPLLWERLWPNPTFPPGILVALLYATLPLVIFLVYLILTGRWRLNWRKGGVILATLLLFLGVGLVASVKIGGGSNLHNLDMFLIGLVFTAALAWSGNGHRLLTNLEREPTWVQGTFVIMMIILAYNPLMLARPLSLPPSELVHKALDRTRHEVEEAKNWGEVLFLDQRQLLTFKYIQDIPLVPDYEKKYLMDQALAANSEYFEQFYRDLADFRFPLIVSEPLKINYRGSDYRFGDENDAWVKWVSEPVLCYYKPKVTFKELRLQLLIPRDSVTDCEGKYGQLDKPGGNSSP